VDIEIFHGLTRHSDTDSDVLVEIFATMTIFQTIEVRVDKYRGGRNSSHEQ
jgi:hypothetical protein